MKSYEVRCGGRAVARMTAPSAQEALGEYLRGLGCSRTEIVRMGSDAAAWRGATYRAVPAEAARAQAAT
jgi:hypothetical protein